MRQRITEEFRKQVIDYYLQRPMSINTLAEHFGICGITASRALGDTPHYPKNRLFNPNLNEDFFKEIDDEFKAYFLGLIISDGNVYDPNDSSHSTAHSGSKWVSITLQDYDSYMLGIFRNKIGLSASVASDGRGSSYVAVRSTKMANDLEKYGIFQRKSFDTKYPDNIQFDLHRHLIRGIIDGDGSIHAYFHYDSKRNRNRFKHRISCCGTHRLMTEMVDIIKNNIELEFVPNVYDYKNRMLSEFKVTNIHDMYLFGKWLYEGSHVFLERKHDEFKKFTEHYGLEYNIPICNPSTT